MYLSDKRPINLFALSPAALPRARSIKAASSNLLVRPAIWLLRIPEDFYFRDGRGEEDGNGGKSRDEPSMLGRRESRRDSYEFFPNPPFCRHVDATLVSSESISSIIGEPR